MVGFLALGMHILQRPQGSTFNSLWSTNRSPQEVQNFFIWRISKAIDSGNQSNLSKIPYTLVKSFFYMCVHGEFYISYSDYYLHFGYSTPLVVINNSYFLNTWHAKKYISIARGIWNFIWFINWCRINSLIHCFAFEAVDLNKPFCSLSILVKGINTFCKSMLLSKTRGGKSEWINLLRL